jgi:hypothetical protein
MRRTLYAFMCTSVAYWFVPRGRGCSKCQVNKPCRTTGVTNQDKQGTGKWILASLGACGKNYGCCQPISNVQSGACFQTRTSRCILVSVVACNVCVVFSLKNVPCVSPDGAFVCSGSCIGCRCCISKPLKPSATEQPQERGRGFSQSTLPMPWLTLPALSLNGSFLWKSATAFATGRGQGF